MLLNKSRTKRSSAKDLRLLRLQKSKTLMTKAKKRPLRPFLSKTLTKVKNGPLRFQPSKTLTKAKNGPLRSQLSKTLTKAKNRPPRLFPTLAAMNAKKRLVSCNNREKKVMMILLLEHELP